MKKFILLLSVLFLFSCTKETIKYTLTTSVNPVEGGTVIPATREYNEGDIANLIATPSAEYVFDKWTGATGTEETTIVMDAPKTVVANFIKKKYALTTAVEGEGTVTEKIIKAGAATDYNSGTVVELTATPSAGWKFKDWSGDLSGTDNPKEITIDKPKTVTAVFEALPPFYLDENGVTIKAYDWVTAGTTGELGGVTYTAVDIDKLKLMFTKEEDVSKVVTTLITDMSDLFVNAPTETYSPFAPSMIKFNPDISSWDVSNVTNMSVMFGVGFDNQYDYSGYGCEVYFNQDISKWDVSKVTNMSEMFLGATRFNQDIGNWDVSQVTDMGFMFPGLQNGILSNFNQDIGSWDVSKVTNMSGMFAYNSAFNQDIGSWDVSNATNMSLMFTDYDISKSVFNQDISKWDVSKVTDMSGMFSKATAFNQDIGSWDVSKVINMDSMFMSTNAFNQDIGSWDVSKVINMDSMFMLNNAFNQDIGSWDVSNVTNMSQMFRLSKFNQNICSWDVSNVTNMYSMFQFAVAFNQDLTKWCVTEISTEPDFFSSSSALTEVNKPIWGTCPGSSYAISVTASSNTNYTLSGKDRNGDVSGNDPGLTFKVGDEVTFSVNAAGHPFYLKTVAGTGTGNQISGVTNNGTTSGSVVWTPTAAGTYYYQCGPHAEMVGTITIQN